MVFPIFLRASQSSPLPLRCHCCFLRLLLAAPEVATAAARQRTYKQTLMCSTRQSSRGVGPGGRKFDRSEADCRPLPNRESRGADRPTDRLFLNSFSQSLARWQTSKVFEGQVFPGPSIILLRCCTCLVRERGAELLGQRRGMENRCSEDGGYRVEGVPTHDGQYIRYSFFGILFEVPNKYVSPIRPIGRGAYGIVCAAVNSETGEEVAIKKIGNAFSNRIDAKRTLREIKLLRHMDHANIIAIKDIIRPPRRENFNDVYIVYELMDTDLDRIIHSHEPLTDEHCQYFLYQLLRGLRYLHSAGVLHRDLKPGNLFLNANCDLRIGDFGLARTTSETDLMTEYVVTRWYRAPELLLNCSEYTAAIDIWSVGCIIAEVATREPLFPGRDYIHQLRLITELIGSPDDSSLGFLRSNNARSYVRQLPQYPRQQFSERFPQMSPVAVDLLEKMLVFDPSKRITVEQALCHPYLSALHDINDEVVCPPPFNFDFEQSSFTEENIKELIWRESLTFNPEPSH